MSFFVVSLGHQRKADGIPVLGASLLNEIPVILCLLFAALGVGKSKVEDSADLVLTQQTGAVLAFSSGWIS